ncbi:hypothetical protein AAY473_033613 [Plecturocebus cupreus]
MEFKVMNTSIRKDDCSETICIRWHESGVNGELGPVCLPGACPCEKLSPVTLQSPVSGGTSHRGGSPVLRLYFLACLLDMMGALRGHCKCSSSRSNDHSKEKPGAVEEHRQQRTAAGSLPGSASYLGLTETKQILPIWELNKIETRLGTVAHACNPSTSGGQVTQWKYSAIARGVARWGLWVQLHRLKQPKGKELKPGRNPPFQGNKS